MVDILDNPAELENFLRMERWIFDSPDQAGEAFRQFIKDFYQGNKLVKGTLDIGGQSVDLGMITQPVLNIFAEQDHLVPTDRSEESRVGKEGVSKSRSWWLTYSIKKKTLRYTKTLDDDRQRL